MSLPLQGQRYVNGTICLILTMCWTGHASCLGKLHTIQWKRHQIREDWRPVQCYIWRNVGSIWPWQWRSASQNPCRPGCYQANTTPSSLPPFTPPPPPPPPPPRGAVSKHIWSCLHFAMKTKENFQTCKVFCRNFLPPSQSIEGPAVYGKNQHLCICADMMPWTSLSPPAPSENNLAPVQQA